MKYACWMCLTVIEKDAEATFERFTELPFPPFIGLLISVSERGHLFRCDSVEWSLENDSFALTDVGLMDFDCDCTEEYNCCKLDVEHYLNDGWSLVGEVRREYDRLFKPNSKMFYVDKWIGSESAPWRSSPPITNPPVRHN